MWRARRRLGGQAVNVPNSWNFSDLHTADASAARAFCGTAFGWEADDLEFYDLDGGEAESAVMWRRPGYGDHLAATIDPDIHSRQAKVHAPPGFADGVAWLAPVTDDEVPHWHVSFAVADRVAAVATAIGLGAVDLRGPIDSMWTKSAVVRDPQRATFTLIQFTPPDA